LNSSLAQSVAEFWPAKVCSERANYAFSEKLGIRPKSGFVAHNFGYRYASKSIKGSIDADFDLVFNKTLSQRMGQMGWSLGSSIHTKPVGFKTVGYKTTCKHLQKLTTTQITCKFSNDLCLSHFVLICSKIKIGLVE